MELQRAVIWIVFGMSLVMLWDRWELAHGRRAMFFPAMSSAPVDAAPGGPQAPAETPAAATNGAISLPGAVPGPAAPASVAGERVHLQTDLVAADFDARGAGLVRLELLQEDAATNWTAEGIAGFVTRNPAGPGGHVILFERDGQRTYAAESGLVGGAAGEALPNHLHTVYRVLPGARELGAGERELQLVFEGESGGVVLRKTYVFHRGSYAIDVRHEVLNTGPEAVSPSLYLQITRDDGKIEGESRWFSTYTGPAFYSLADSNRFEKISFEDIAKGKATKRLPAKDGWVAMIQHYFVSAWVPSGDVGREFYTRRIGDSNVYQAGTIVPLGAVAPGAKASVAAVLYAGPQDQASLEAIAPGLDRVVDYGRLEVFAKPLFWLLGFFHGLVNNWGWAIVLLTVFVKAALYPVAAAGFKSMARMKDVAPRMQALKERFGDDQNKFREATMELYKREKINPLGGCLPIVIQIPIFLSLYWVLLESVEMRNAPWVLWIHDLATPDPWFVLPGLMMLTSWIQFTLQPTPADPIQARMMMIMPFVFGVMFFFFPAGLVLYYVLNNALSILQQWRINSVLARAKAAAAG